MIPHFVKKYAARGALIGTLLAPGLFGLGCEDDKSGRPGIEDSLNDPDAGTGYENIPPGATVTPVGPAQPEDELPVEASEGEGEYTPEVPADPELPIQPEDPDKPDDPIIPIEEPVDPQYDGGEGEGEGEGELPEDDLEVPVDLPENGGGQGLDKAPECRRLAGGYTFASELTMNLLLDHAHNGGEGVTILMPDRDLENDSPEIEMVEDYLTQSFVQLGSILGDVEVLDSSMTGTTPFYIPLEKIVRFGQEEYRIKVLRHEREHEWNGRNENNVLVRTLDVEINGELFEHEFRNEYGPDLAEDGNFHEILPNEDSPEDAVYAFFGWGNGNAVFESIQMMLTKGQFVDTKMTVRLPQDNESRTYTLQTVDGEDISFKLRVQDDIENWAGNGVDVFMGEEHEEDWEQGERDIHTGRFYNMGHLGFGMVLKGAESIREMDDNGVITETRYVIFDLYATQGQDSEKIPLDFAPRKRHSRPGDPCPPHTLLIQLGFNTPTIHSTDVDEEGNEEVHYEAAVRQNGPTYVAAQKTLRPLTSIRPDELPDIAEGVLDHRGAFLDTSTVVYTDNQGVPHAYPQIVIGGAQYEGEFNRMIEDHDELEEHVFGQGPGRAASLLLLQLEDMVD